MKKFIISIAALASLTGAALASESRELAGKPAPGSYAVERDAGMQSSVSVTESAGFAVSNGAGLSSYERLQLRAAEHEYNKN